MNGQAMRAIYEEIRAEATRLAGEPGDIVPRVARLHSIFLDSEMNHTFPQVALHGALWARSFFDVTGTLSRIIQYRYLHNRRERAYRMGMLRTFSEAFKAVNRTVFIDSYTNYHVTKRYGSEAGLEPLIPPPLLAALNQMHAANAAQRPLTPAEKRHLFLQSLQWEQEVSVSPGVQAALEEFECPVLTFLCRRPVVRFAYFPPGRYMLFRDFADRAERIAKAAASYDLAERCGWHRVTESMKAYRVLPEWFFHDPLASVENPGP
jgi:hypothetical protein